MLRNPDDDRTTNVFDEAIYSAAAGFTSLV